MTVSTRPGKGREKERKERAGFCNGEGRQISKVRTSMCKGEVSSCDGRGGGLLQRALLVCGFPLCLRGEDRSMEGWFILFCGYDHNHSNTDRIVFGILCQV